MYRGGGRTLTYSFDISGYSDLTLSMDWAASGDFADPQVYVTTAIDGAVPTTNLMIRSTTVDWSESMEIGTVVTRGRSPSVMVNDVWVDSLSDVFKSYIFPVAGAGTTMVVTLTEAGSPSGAALGMDNMKLYGVSPNEMTYEAWTEYYGLSGTNATWMSDLDGDDRNNLEEFAFGGSPLVPDIGYVPSGIMMQEGGTPFLEYVYARRSIPNHGLIYAVETCYNLVSDDWNTGDAIELPIAEMINEDFESVTNRIPVIGDEGFVRLRVELAQ
jgi:hypothetical protein